MTDLSDPKTLTGKSDQEIFDLIRKGKDKMLPKRPRAPRTTMCGIW